MKKKKTTARHTAKATFSEKVAGTAVCLCLLSFLAAALVAEYIPALIVCTVFGVICFGIGWLFDTYKIGDKKKQPARKQRMRVWTDWDECYYISLIK